MRKSPVVVDFENPQTLELIGELAGKGLTNAQVARKLQITPQTFNKHLNNKEEVRTALEEGRANAVDQVASALFQAAIEGCTKSQQYYLRTVAGWRERETQTATVSGNADAAFDTIEKEQLALLRAKAEQADKIMKESEQQLPV